MRQGVRAPYCEALERRTLLAASAVGQEVGVEDGIAGAAVTMALREPQALPPALPLGLLVKVRGDMPAVTAGAQAKINQFVNVLNLSGARLTGPVTVRLYLSRNGSLDANDVEVATVTRKLRLEQLQSREVRVKVARVPAAADGQYRLLAVAWSPGGLGWAGAIAMDFGSRFSSASAAGIIDAVGAFGTIITGVGMGYLIDNYGWNTAFLYVLGLTLLATLSSFALWNTRAESSNREASI